MGGMGKGGREAETQSCLSGEMERSGGRVKLGRDVQNMVTVVKLQGFKRDI